MVPPASPSPLLSPAPLAVLAHRYGAGAPAVVELIRRTGGCTSPIRLEGESVAVSARTGAVVARRSTRSQAPGFVLVACGNRRESRCPPCSERYRRDAYFLVAAGLRGDEARGVSSAVASHPLVFATFTAPSFGAVHRRVVDAGGVRSCRLGGQAEVCSHGIPMRCLDRHAEDDPRIGQAICPDCYDYEAAALWNANLGALWRRTITYLPRELAALSGSERSGPASPGPCRLCQGRRVPGPWIGTRPCGHPARRPRRSRHRARGRSDGAASSGGRRPHRGARSGHGGGTGWT